jgi:hypothetical protein
MQLEKEKKRKKIKKLERNKSFFLGKVEKKKCLPSSSQQ